MAQVSIGEILTNKNSALQTQEPKGSKTGELKHLEKALASPLIADSGLDQISQVLRLVMMKIGIRAINLPGREETAVLFDHIIENFGGHRIEEIRLAFEMAISYKLDLKTDEINCFENFSCAYFSRVMNAYRLWSAQAARQVITEDPPEQKLYSMEEMEDQQRGDIEHFYQRLRKGQVPYRIPEYFRDILVKDGLMEPGESTDMFFNGKLGNQVENIYVRAEA